MATSSVTREQALKQCGWTSKDGDVEGYFKDKPVGHRCLWTVRWMSDSGIIEPGRLASERSEKADAYELADIQAFHIQAALVDLEKGNFNRARENYKEALWPWGSRPEHLIIPIIRSYWPRPPYLAIPK